MTTIRVKETTDKICSVREEEPLNKIKKLVLHRADSIGIDADNSSCEGIMDLQ